MFPRFHSLVARPLVTFAAAMLSAGCSADASEPTRSAELDAGPSLELVADSSFEANVARIRAHSGIRRAERRVIRDAAAWELFWRRAVRGAAIPAPVVDFARHSVVIVAMGERPTGGYWVDIENVRAGARRLRVEALQSSPGVECIVTMAFTAPLDAVLVPRTELPPAFDVRDVVRDCR